MHKAIVNLIASIALVVIAFEAVPGLVGWVVVGLGIVCTVTWIIEIVILIMKRTTKSVLKDSMEAANNPPTKSALRDSMKAAVNCKKCLSALKERKSKKRSMENPNETPIRGKAIDENTVVDKSNIFHYVNVPKKMIGKDVVVRDGKVNERID